MTDMTQTQVEAEKKFTTEQIIKNEMKIKRASIIAARRSVFGPSCAPTLKDQLLTFSSFGTITKYDWLMSDERYWN